jgi:nucleotide-binding universal stress UspA family protein
MGAHGKSARSEAKTLGAVAREVYAASRRPTVVVPPRAVADPAALAARFASAPAEAARGPRVVCAIDCGPGSAKVIDESVELARRTRGAVRIFAGAPVYPGATAAAWVEKAQQAALAALVQFKVDTGAPDALAGLVEISAQEIDAIIVIGARRAAGRAPGEVGSFTHRLLAEAASPVAVVRV